MTKNKLTLKEVFEIIDNLDFTHYIQAEKEQVKSDIEWKNSVNININPDVVSEKNG